MKTIRLGPMTLVLTVICICLAILGILTYSTAAADSRLADKQAETVTTRYELELEGQRYYQKLCTEGIDGETVDEDGIIYHEITDGKVTLTVGVSTEEGLPIVCWKESTAWEEDTSPYELWDGE